MDGTDVISKKLIFPAPLPPSYTPRSFAGSGGSFLWIPWDGTSPPEAERKSCTRGIPCVLLREPKSPVILLYFHANSEDIGTALPSVRSIASHFKVNVLAVEYPGYGLLHEMSPSEDAIYRTAHTVLRFLLEQANVLAGNIMLCGTSLGTGPSVYLASLYPVGGLVLLSPFLSIKAAVHSFAGERVSWAFKELFPNLALIKYASCPCVLVRGEHDVFCTQEQFQQLFDACRTYKQSVMGRGVGHTWLITAITLDPISDFFQALLELETTDAETIRFPEEVFREHRGNMPRPPARSRWRSSMMCCCAEETLPDKAKLDSEYLQLDPQDERDPETVILAEELTQGTPETPRPLTQAATFTIHR
mmetsp:Transcript_21628/g.50537  ORF Transcript_21628/g.50537 Transcript_21628/m.50537 type:complete len:361 (-) Transcript_21628:48-1130(-)